jgi:hypothetical protein
MSLEMNLERMREDLATSLCTPTQNPEPLKNFGTLLQTNLNACNDSAVS